MDTALYTIRDAPGLGPGGKRVLVECPHGFTSGVVLPGQKDLPGLVFLDLVSVRHERENRCGCSRNLRPKTPMTPNGEQVAPIAARPSIS